MNLALVSTQKGWGGGEGQLAELAAGLRRAGANVSVAAPSGSALERWADQHDFDCLLLPSRGRSPSAMWRLRRWVQSRRFDGVVLNDPHAITYGGVALAGAGAPRVGVRHTVFPVRSAWKHNRLLEAVVAVSQASADRCFEAGVDRDRVQVIHGGVQPRAADPEAIAAAKGLLGEGPTVLAIGSLLRVKGFDTLIEAAAQSSQPWRLAIAGEGPERETLEALIDKRGLSDRVRLLGFCEDVRALLAASDAMVSASHNEGLSLVLIEAMLAGRPIAATPVGGAREVLGMQAGENSSPYAATFEPGDPAGAARAIEAALAADASRVESAEAWARDRFTIDRVAADYVALFERLTGATAGRIAA